MKRRHILVAATALAAARGIAAAPAVTWKWASGYRADSFHGRNLSQFAADVDADGPHPGRRAGRPTARR
jgi:TRAP-type C4-dicarboxylate transport system substrate-binding protein